MSETNGTAENGLLTSAWIPAVVVVLAVATVPAAFLYPDRPLPGHTGGFGEPTCHVCHFDNPLNDPSGRLLLEGLPAELKPGETYRLTVRVEHPDLGAGGFQLSARMEDGSAAGAFSIPDQGAAISKIEGRDVEYVHHALPGTQPADGEAAWEVTWTAPSNGPVLFHVAGNAANGDDSEFGDFIYTLEKRRPVK